MWQHYDGITSLAFASLLRVASYSTQLLTVIKSRKFNQKIQHIKLNRMNSIFGFMNLRYFLKSFT